MFELWFQKMTSLTKSLSCKVDHGQAERASSARFLNPGYALCPTHTGKDGAGREAHPNTLYSKTSGCHSALDRVSVENEVCRPHYYPFITPNSSISKGYANFGGPNVSNIKSATCGYQIYNQSAASMSQHHPANASNSKCGGSRIVEGFVQTPKEAVRNNSAANASYRSCRFTQMSGM